MNSRRNSVENQHKRLDYYYREVVQIILKRQDPCTGLLPASVAVTSHGDYRDAWVRDNVYSIIAVWGLSLAYKKLDDNEGKCYELEHSVVKLMRGLLFAMMRQAQKVEEFKNEPKETNCLHAKYNTSTGDTVVKDDEWGHLQIDATSLFLLILAQMSASGLSIIFNQDEVDFIQNLVFYIERAYRTPDYGIWERGNKTNHGEPELNSSSIGMAVAALQAIDGINLFGLRGGPSSAIHVLPDEITRNYITLHTALPRESNSKEIDAALLSIVGYPAFSVGDPYIYDKTYKEIVQKLEGKYGCKRFLLDGHQTAVEDTKRLYYEPKELKIFKNIESEWPLFFTYFILNGLFTCDYAMVDKYTDLILPLLVDSNTLDSFNFDFSKELETMKMGTTKNVCKTPPLTPRLNRDHFYLVPELYYVTKDAVEKEKIDPKSQHRLANDNVPLVWANSLYILGCLISENLLEVAQIDPLGRRLQMNKVRQSKNIVVQIALLSQTIELQGKLDTLGIQTQTVVEIKPFNVCKSGALKEIYGTLGMNKKLGLTGRPNRPIGTLGTCRLYKIQGKLVGFVPYFMDKEEFYLSSDNQYLISQLRKEIAFVQNNWYYSGRPTLIIVLDDSMLDQNLEDLLEENTPQINNTEPLENSQNLIDFVMELKNGECNGVRIRLGKINEFINTSCIISLDFLVNRNDIDIRKTLDNYSIVEKEEGSHQFGQFDLKSPRSRPKSLSNVWINTSFTLDEVQKDNFDWNEESRIKSRDEDCDQKPTMILGNPSQLAEAILSLPLKSNPYDQIDIIHYILSIKGMDFHVDTMGTNISSLLEDINKKAMKHKYWSIVRQAAGLLHKMANSLTVNIINLVIKRRFLTFGLNDEIEISSPLTPDAIEKIIFKSCGSDIREASVVQEVLTSLGHLIITSPKLFTGILALRTHYIIVALKEEIARSNKMDIYKASESLFEMSPFTLAGLLATTLSGPLLLDSDHKVIVSDTTNNQRINNFKLGSKIKIEAQSGGYESGNYAKVDVNDEPVDIVDRGFCLVILDCLNGFIQKHKFDTHTSAYQSTRLTKLVDSLSVGMIVIGVVKDEATQELSKDTRKALKTLGCSDIDKLGYRDSYAFVGVKGASPGSIPESSMKKNMGPTQVLHVQFDPNDKMDKFYHLFNSDKYAMISRSDNKLVGKWIRRRKNDGAYCRVPKGFYPTVWRLLSDPIINGDRSFVIPSLENGKVKLYRDPVVFEKTREENNFAKIVHNFLVNAFLDPTELVVAVKLIGIIAWLLDRFNDGKYQLLFIKEQDLMVYFDALKIALHNGIVFSKFINCAINLFYTQNTKILDTSNENNVAILDEKQNYLEIRNMFFDLPDKCPNGLSYYLAKAFLDIVGLENKRLLDVISDFDLL